MDKLKTLDLIEKVLDSADKCFKAANEEKNMYDALKEFGKGNGLIIAADIINKFFGKPVVLDSQHIVVQVKGCNN